MHWKKKRLLALIGILVENEQIRIFGLNLSRYIILIEIIRFLIDTIRIFFIHFFFKSEFSFSVFKSINIHLLHYVFFTIIACYSLKGLIY